LRQEALDAAAVPGQRRVEEDETRLARLDVNARRLLRDCGQCHHLLD